METSAGRTQMAVIPERYDVPATNALLPTCEAFGLGLAVRCAEKDVTAGYHGHPYLNIDALLTLVARDRSCGGM